MPTVLITGANRGLGLEFARQYARDGWSVIATARESGSADDLRAIDGVQVEALDAGDLDTVVRFGERLGEAPLDVFIANAGTYGPRQIETAADGEGWLDALKVMAVSPVLMARALMPNLAQARGKAVAITSRMGSIADNDSGGFIAYRSAKATVNAAWTSLAIDGRDDPVAFALLHPGWVQTRMGGANAPVTPHDSIAGMRAVIAGLRPTGRAPFLDFQGQTVPW